MANDKVEGAMKKAQGSAESGFGNISQESALEFKGKAKKAMGSLQQALGDAKEYMHNSCDAVSTRINDKPVQSAFIALGVGYLLSKLLKR